MSGVRGPAARRKRPAGGGPEGLGYRFPVRYDFRWDQESRVWAGTCQEMAEPPKDLAVNRAKRRRRST